MQAPNRICQTFPFRLESDTKRCQTGCWSEAEEQHTWALSPQCGLSIPVAGSVNNLALLIDVEPALALPSVNKRLVSIFVNSLPVLQIEIRKRGVFLLPIGIAPAASVVTIDFHFNNPECRFASETRPLALMFRKAILLDRPSLSSADLSIKPGFSLTLD